MNSKSDDSQHGSLNESVSLERLLRQSEKIKQEVEQSAGELTSINTTFKKDNNLLVSVHEIQTAILQNECVERNVAKSADDLNQVNTQLVNELDERVDIKLQLEDTKVDLAEVRRELQSSQAKESEARHMSLKDSLTGIANRASFEQSLEQALAEAKRHQWRLAVLFIDIDKFKSINDTYGHDHGDKVLTMVASRLQSSIRQEDTVCRWGGDEFVCLMLEVKKPNDVSRFAKKLVMQIAGAFEINGVPFSVKSSIGIAIFPQDGETSIELLKNADIAMFKAKGSKQRVVLCQGASGD
jgi:diguanylate cyclase